MEIPRVAHPRLGRLDDDMTEPDSRSRRQMIERSGVALCLSGGGYRAALFHLGALRRLNELGILSQVDTISAVSGGSILAAHLARHLPAWAPSGDILPDWDARVAQPFKEFVRRNIRTGPLLRRAAPWNWLRSSTQVNALANQYRRHLNGQRLCDLPERPNYIFCATDISYGVNWEFSRLWLGDYQFGHSTQTHLYSIAEAVAASSCFPPIFSPLRLRVLSEHFEGGRAAHEPLRHQIALRLSLSDGGLYDNLGLEPVWKKSATLIVSDGGSTFTSSIDGGPIWRLSRYTTVLGAQASAMRRRWLAAQLLSGELRGAYWGISANTEHKVHTGYSAAFVNRYVASIRTDLDSFSEAEIAVLENHGYVRANLGARRYLRHMVGDAVPLRLPNPSYAEEAPLVAMLRNSSHRVLPFGRTAQASS